MHYCVIYGDGNTYFVRLQIKRTLARNESRLMDIRVESSMSFSNKEIVVKINLPSIPCVLITYFLNL